MSAVVIAWFLLSFVVILTAAATAIADLYDRKQRRGRSWEIPQQRRADRLSGRY